MKNDTPDSINRRTVLKGAAAATLGAAGLGAASYWLGGISRVSKSVGKKVIIVGIDGMDPRLTASMMREGLLPNFAKMSSQGGFSELGTSCPPQSPVAWSNFINGSGPGSHGIFDFIHRHPHEQWAPFYSAAETVPGEGGWDVGDHQLKLDFWPFQHKPTGNDPQAARHAILGLPGRSRNSVDFLRSSRELSAQSVKARPSSLHQRNGHSGHAGRLWHLSVFRRGRTSKSVG